MTENAPNAYEQLRQVSPLAGVVLANNPNHMTLEGTNTWVLRAPGARTSIVIDPGPDDAAHLAAVRDAGGSVETILLTHGHPDHSDGAKAFHEMTGAPVRALDPKHRYGIEGLGEGDVVSAAGVQLRIWSTPGHTSDSLCFLLPGEGVADDAVLTGDTILGRGTTVVAYPDGNLADYLASLRRLAALGDMTVLTGHGPELPRAGEVAEYYLKHREERLAQVRDALATLGPDATARQVVEVVYADVDTVLWKAAEASVNAQLEYLRAG